MIDEIRWARQMPHLEHRVMVVKEKDVRLPSNINPTWENADREHLQPTLDRIISQLQEWDLLADAPVLVETVPAPVQEVPTEDDASIIETLTKDIDLGDHDKAERRLFRLLGTLTEEGRDRCAKVIFRALVEVPDSEESHRPHILSSLLEAMARLDLDAVPVSMAETLAQQRDFTKRSCAANLLWDRAKAAPGTVPISLVARLARPSAEDWYVYSPALACAKHLLLVRESAGLIFWQLAESDDVDDRDYAIGALADVASIEPRAVDPKLVERLSPDNVAHISDRAKALAERLRTDVTKEERKTYRWPFGL